MIMAIKRLPAKKSRIFDLVNGKFFPGIKEKFKPSYLITSFGEKISRVNLVATVTDKFVREDENYSTITLDDGSGSIRAKAFKEKTDLLKSIEVGNMVLVIGKIKKFNEEVYVNAEIVKKIEDPNYESLRKLEILDELIPQKEMIEEIKNLHDELSEEELKNYAKEKFNLDEESLRVILEFKRTEEIDYKPKVLELIKNLDKGEGVELSKLLKSSNLPEDIIENAVNELLSSGHLFEPNAGKFRIV
jgi:hypothetical protein